MRNILCVLAISFAGAYACGAAGFEFQNRNLDQDYFGPDTWRTGDGVTNLPPASGDAVYVTSGTGYDTTVTVTNDVSVDYKYLVFKAQPSSSFKFLTAGDAHTFEMPYSDGAAYAANALYMHDGGGNAFATISGAVSSNPVFSWTDPMFTL